MASSFWRSATIASSARCARRSAWPSSRSHPRFATNGYSVANRELLRANLKPAPGPGARVGVAADRGAGPRGRGQRHGQAFELARSLGLHPTVLASQRARRVEAQRPRQRERLADVVDPAGGDAAPRPAASAHSAAPRPPSRPLQLGAQRLAVGRPGRRWSRTARRRELGRAEHLAQRGELPVVADREHELAVGGRESSYGAMLGWRVAHPPRDHAGDRVRRALVDQRAQQRRRAGRPRPAGPRRSRRGARSAARIPTVANSPASTSTSATPDLLRLAVRLAGDAHQPAERLHQQVVAGQLGAGAARRSR